MSLTAHTCVCYMINNMYILYIQLWSMTKKRKHCLENCMTASRDPRIDATFCMTFKPWLNFKEIFSLSLSRCFRPTTFYFPFFWLNSSLHRNFHQHIFVHVILQRKPICVECRYIVFLIVEENIFIIFHSVDLLFLSM